MQRRPPALPPRALSYPLISIIVYILSSCHIHDRRVTVDGHTRFEVSDRHASAADFLAEAFRQTGIDYRKFYKMDPLARLGFLAAELLLPPPIADEPLKEDWGLICFNSTASLAADRTYQRTIPPGDDFFPSPADFVYTLPNIVTGEIAIRHKIQGETMFYILPAFLPTEICHIVCETVRDAGLHHALVGWVDIDTASDRLDARVMHCVDRPNEGSPAFTPDTLSKLFP